MRGCSCHSELVPTIGILWDARLAHLLYAVGDIRDRRERRVRNLRARMARRAGGDSTRCQSRCYQGDQHSARPHPQGKYLTRGCKTKRFDLARTGRPAPVDTNRACVHKHAGGDPSVHILDVSQLFCLGVDVDINVNNVGGPANTRLVQLYLVLNPLVLPFMYVLADGCDKIPCGNQTAGLSSNPYSTCTAASP